MSDRCILCGAGDESIDHPDYIDWVKTMICKIVVDHFTQVHMCIQLHLHFSYQHDSELGTL